MNYFDILKPNGIVGDRIFIREERVLLVELVKQRDDPPGRPPLAERVIPLAESTRIIPSQALAKEIKDVNEKNS